MSVELLILTGQPDRGYVRGFISGYKSKLHVAPPLIGNFYVNVDGRIEYIDLRIRDIDLYVGEIEAFLFAVQPHSLGHCFVHRIHAIRWPTQPNLDGVHADAHYLIAFGQLTFKLNLDFHRQLDNGLEPNRNCGWMKTLDLYVFA